MEKEYVFTMKLRGWGTTPEEAWADVQESMGGDMSHTAMPEEHEATE